MLARQVFLEFGLLLSVWAACIATGSSTRPRRWPPGALAEALYSQDWALAAFRAGLPRRCEDRWDAGDRCKSTRNGPRVKVCWRTDSAEVQPASGSRASGQDTSQGSAQNPAVCDEYSVGSGYCPMVSSAYTLYYSQRNASQPRALVDPNHCFTRVLGASNMFLCPLRAPIAVAVMRKAGSNTIGQWLYAMEGNNHPNKLSDLWFPGVHAGQDDAMLKVVDWLFGPRGLGVPTSLQLDMEQRSRVLERMQYEHTQHMPTSKLVLPSGWCLPCCQAAAGRLPVMLVRNPFRRLASFFRHKWVGNEHKAPYNHWDMFPAWLRLLAEHRRRYANGTATGHRAFYSFAATPPMGSNDVTHTLSLAELLNDPRWTLDARRALRSRLFPLRLEVIGSDLKRLSKVLCEQFGACRPLPPLPNVVPAGFQRPEIDNAPPWEKMWPAESVRLVRRLYASDLAWLGYSRDPLDERPVHEPLTWSQARVGRDA